MREMKAPKKIRLIEELQDFLDQRPRAWPRSNCPDTGLRQIH
jgi:hypothetical protein